METYNRLYSTYSSEIRRVRESIEKSEPFFPIQVKEEILDKTIEVFFVEEFNFYDIKCVWHGQGVLRELSVNRETATKFNIKSSILVSVK
jgi:hypothetical protein